MPDDDTMEMEDELLLLDGPSIEQLLVDCELEIMEQTRRAYELHDGGASALPHSVFLRFPDEPRNRIIGLPGYLGGDYQTAGIKWIASFPGNVENGIDRASALLILNSMRTGRPKAVLESSIVSAKRTAASAALAARHLAPEGYAELGLVGCGLIGFEIARFIAASTPALDTVTVYDLDATRARRFVQECERAFPRVRARVAASLDAMLARCPTVAFATTASAPYLHDRDCFRRGGTVLHVSLRDIGPEIIAASDNIVDDVEHVTREGTSIYLAREATGQLDFVRGTLAQVCLGRVAPKRDPAAATIFSPFGLGVLDLAVGEYVLSRARALGAGTQMPSFFPRSWHDPARPQRTAATG